MIEFVKKYGFNVYSQNGEDGIIGQCLSRMNIKKGVCIEFGAADGYYCSNTRCLVESGWDGFMFDINPSGPGVMKKEITPENVNDLPPCNVLSIDTDGPDYKIWQAYNGTPDIVIIEINSSLPPDRDYFNFASGASYKIMVELGISKGYFLVCHTGNLIFLLNKYRGLFPEITGNGIENWQDYFNTSWQC